MAKKKDSKPLSPLIDPTKLADMQEIAKILKSLPETQRIYIAGAVSMAQICQGKVV